MKSKERKSIEKGEDKGKEIGDDKQEERRRRRSINEHGGLNERASKKPVKHAIYGRLDGKEKEGEGT